MSGLKCGAAKVKITPPDELLPKLYGLMHTHYAGVIDDIYVRVLILECGTDKTMLVSWELDKAPNPHELVPALSKQTGVPEDNILFFAVHTHTAPLHSARPDDGPNGRAKQPAETQAATLEFEALLAEGLQEAAAEAMAKMAPVKIGWGEGESFIGENRVTDYYVEQEDGSIVRTVSVGSNPKGPVDHTLFVMRIEDMEGKPVAFFVNHPVHCCTMIMNNFDGKGGVGISGDIAGATSGLLEEKYPGCVALWSSGAAGNINPVMMNQYNYADPADGSAKEFREVGSAEPAKLMLLIMSRRHFADIQKLNRAIVCDISDAQISGGFEVTSLHFDTEKGDMEYDVRLKGVRIGDTVLCGVSGELFCTLGMSVKSVSDFKHTVIINHECTFSYNSGYIFDDDALRRATLPDGSRNGLPGLRGCPLQPGPLEPALKESAGKLFERLK